MECPACGAISKKRSMKCPECGAFRNKSSVAPQQRFASEPAPSADAQPSAEWRPRQSRSLIEFPGARNTMPQWRKELGERVREVQERRLRESALETGANEVGAPEEAAKGATLELLPQAEVSPLNPLVVAALRRIERAHVSAAAGGNYSTATAVAYAAQPEFASYEPSDMSEATTAPLQQHEENPQRSSLHPERVHNLAVVPNASSTSESLRESSPEKIDATLRPKRLIGGDPNDPALNYLDAIPTAALVDASETRTAPIPLRIVGSVFDLVVICLLSLLPLSLVKLTDLEWQDPRVITFAVGAAILVAFLYSTISTALTGRTLGMRLCKLRVVDARTRMLPTGSQAAGRAVVYLLSVATSGLPLMYAFIDRDQRAAHDRFTRTEVVRM